MELDRDDWDLDADRLAHANGTSNQTISTPSFIRLFRIRRIISKYINENINNIRTKLPTTAKHFGDKKQSNSWLVYLRMIQ